MKNGVATKRKSKGKSIVATDKKEVLDPRQAMFLSRYLDPKSDTFSNALQSALAAGYAPEYAQSITAQMPSWLSESISENISKQYRISRAEKHLDEVLDLPIIMQAMGAFGPLFEKVESRVKGKNGKMKKVVKKIPIMVPNTGIIKEKSKIAQFALEALDKATYGKSTGTKLSFTFNAAGARARYEA